MISLTYFNSFVGGLYPYILILTYTVCVYIYIYKYIYPGWVTVQGVWASKHRPLYVGYAMSSNTTSQITIESEGLRLRTGNILHHFALERT